MSALACVGLEPEVLPPTSTRVGIDVGLKTFATLSDGQEIENPRFFRQEEKALARAQRKLSKAEKGTPERKAKRKIVARIHERTTLSRLICYLRFPHFKSILDNDTYQFRLDEVVPCGVELTFLTSTAEKSLTNSEQLRLRT